MNSIYIVCLFVVASALISRRLLHSWLHPAALLLLLWSCIFVSTSIFAPDYYFSLTGGGALLSLMWIFLVGGIIGSHQSGKLNQPNKKIISLDFKVRYVSSMLILGIGFGYVAVAIILYTQGISISSLTNIDMLATTAHEFSVARYEDSYRMPALARLMLSVNYVSVAISGIIVGAGNSFYWNKRGGVRKILLFMPLTPQIILSIIMTTRAQVLYEMIVWGSFFIAAAIFSKDTGIHKLMQFKKLALLILVVFFVFVMFVSLQFLRGGITDFSRIWEILEHLRKWPFGSIAGFAIWFDSNAKISNLSFGAYTFAGLFDLVGIKSRETGLYIDYVDLGGGAYGNIYTAFRGLFEDFGIIGAYISLLVAGIIFGFCYESTKRTSNIKLLPLLALGYMGIFWSPIVSLYAYFSIVFNVLLVTIALILFSNAIQKRYSS